MVFLYDRFLKVTMLGELTIAEIHAEAIVLIIPTVQPSGMGASRDLDFQVRSVVKVIFGIDFHSWSVGGLI